MATNQEHKETNRDAKKHVCPTPHLEGHVCSNSQGEALKKLRKEKRLSLKKLSESSGVLVTTLEKVESGHSRLTYKGLIKVAKGFKISPLALTSAALDQSPVFKKTKKVRA